MRTLSTALVTWLLIAVISPASAQTCAEDDFGGPLNCSATDVVVTNLEVLGQCSLDSSIWCTGDPECTTGNAGECVRIPIDGCEFIGDTAEVRLRTTLQTSASVRHDIGIYLATDAGGAEAGDCYHDFLPPPLSLACLATSSGTGPFCDRDSDACGDIISGQSSVPFNLGYRALASDPVPVALPCVDRDLDGSVEIPAVVVWANASAADCFGEADAIATGPSRCSNSALGVSVAGLSVPPQSIEVHAVVDNADPGDEFGLSIDGVVHAITNQSQASTGPIPAIPATATVAVTPGNPSTNLSDYTSSITCVETVGACAHDPLLRCVTDAMCGGLSICQLAPVTVSSCSSCTSLDVAIPADQSTIRCTISATRLPPPECSNGIDDDGDTLIDFPADPGCAEPTDSSEVDTDLTPPSITTELNGTLGTNGWYTSDVAISWTVVDAESPVSSTTDCGPSVVASDTAGANFTCSATSGGGTASESALVARDATSPVASFHLTPTANANGWNSTDVEVTFTAVDGLSGIAACDPAVVLSSEGADQTGSGTCIDAAGNTSVEVSAQGIDIDKTAPNGFISMPVDGATYLLSSVVLADYFCLDGLSGILDCTGSVVNGESIDTTSIGFKEFSVDATDLAGNLTRISVDYEVVPEPSMGILLAAGVASIAARRPRRIH